LAKMHSKCPSGKSAGGKLGKFKPGMMVPVSLWFACLGVIVCFVY
jgi:hypothetical protein